MLANLGRRGMIVIIVYVNVIRDNDATADIDLRNASDNGISINTGMISDSDLTVILRVEMSKNSAAFSDNNGARNISDAIGA